MSDDLTRKGLANEAKGLGKQAEGKIRNAAGALTGDTSEQLKGKALDAAGKVQRKFGEMQEEVDARTKAAQKGNNTDLTDL